ncbi:MULTISPECIES: AMP-binding protein [unclassified Herbaspirillum]|uniref:phenylacetate--CoA ligase family protein n=1 Tax=unclassified Herbaspirillum TaxID=2624150 RepID=UPI000E2FA08C|nr:MULTISPECIES: AMP-binding protein [unclassified Herbaspirillum]RFB67077.1 phenylacetate--CoA ligase family protein [Herbaspirillum sp. 3R-3a1]TFI06116.1 phenylacetate--CoA ligase family protein [Herbaspirillum sp. 3R11]TFI14272.1 phenylacetate--CoA ligase family protein [Herbaspirillum sp. 3R-11]TFI30393.1 phenylacetate--CoA ligase family protein [Herbaspirillum sp. 3C11]
MRSGALIAAAPVHLDPAESWDRATLEAFQLAQLRVQLARLARDSAYYAPLFRQLDWNVGELRSLADLSKLPFTTKPDYINTIGAQTPFGRFMTVPQDEVRRMHFSSGTTSAPSPQFWSEHDLDRWAGLYARHARAQGIGPGDIVQCMFSYTWFVGGLGATAGYQRAGAMVIPAGSQDTERQINTLFTYGSTVLCGTPSFITHLAEEVRKRGRDPAASTVRSIMMGGEPGASIPATRRRIEALWGARAYDAYGCLEFQPIAGDCTAQAGPHLAEDFAYAEIVDAETGAAVADGTPGVLVLTHLDKQAGPLVRWWTGDIVVRDSSPCSCGRTHARLVGGVRGRADDMLVVRGVNVFPSAVEELVRATPGLGDEYQLVINGSVHDAAGFMKSIHVRVEQTDTAADTSRLAAQLTQEIKQRLQVGAHVEVLPQGTLERSTHKAKRVVRE